MRIVLACEIFPPDIGGPATYAVQLADALRKAGHTVRAISYGEVRKAFPYTVTLVSRRIPFLLRQFVYFVRLCYLLQDADLIYAQGPSVGPAAIWVRRLTRYQKNHDRGKSDTLNSIQSNNRQKIPVVVKFVGDQSWQQIRMKGSKIGFEEYMSEYGKRWHDLKTFWIQRWQKFSLCNADHVVVPSRYLKKVITQYLNVDEDFVEVIPNGVEVRSSVISSSRVSGGQTAVEKSHNDSSSDHDEVSPLVPIGSGLGRDDVGSKKNVLFVGRFENWKGLDTLIDALKLLPNDFMLTLVGDGSEKENLALPVTRYALRDRVTFAGRIPHPELPKYFKRAMCFFEGSQYEGMPHVVLESWSFGIPVIVSDFPANTELVQDGETGLVFKLGDSKDLADTILKLSKDKDLWCRISYASFEEHKKYDKNKIMERTIEFLEKVVCGY